MRNVPIMFSLMPAGHRPIKPHPSKPWRTLKDEVRDGYLMKLQCGLCRRTVYFLPADLIQMVGADHYSHKPPFTCRTCQTSEYLRITVHKPQPGDYGRLPVRRIIKIVRRAKWVNVRLGD